MVNRVFGSVKSGSVQCFEAVGSESSRIDHFKASSLSSDNSSAFYIASKLTITI